LEEEFMTPQERKLVEDLFERLATLERNPREADAEQVIMAGLRKAPNALYPLVQTVLLQEEALRQANERIRELESGEPQQQGGFLDSMRDAVFGGGGERTRGSVPPAGGDRPMGVPPGFPRSGDQYQAQGGAHPQPAEPARGGFGGGSFLGTAAAAAAGVIGGTLLMNSLRGAFGSQQGNSTALGDFAGQKPESANPWSDSSSSDLARQAGIDHVGRPGSGNEQASRYEPSDESIGDDGLLPDDGGFDLDADFL
jgi:hypothetical protein